MVQPRRLPRAVVILPWALASALALSYVLQHYVSFGSSKILPGIRGGLIAVRAIGPSQATAYATETPPVVDRAEPPSFAFGAFMGAFAAGMVALAVSFAQSFQGGMDQGFTQNPIGLQTFSQRAEVACSNSARMVQSALQEAPQTLSRLGGEFTKSRDSVRAAAGLVSNSAQKAASETLASTSASFQGVAKNIRSVSGTVPVPRLSAQQGTVVVASTLVISGVALAADRRTSSTNTNARSSLKATSSSTGRYPVGRPLTYSAGYSRINSSVKTRGGMRQNEELNSLLMRSR